MLGLKWIMLDRGAIGKINVPNHAVGMPADCIADSDKMLGHQHLSVDQGNTVLIGCVLSLHLKQHWFYYCYSFILCAVQKYPCHIKWCIVPHMLVHYEDPTKQPDLHYKSNTLVLVMYEYWQYISLSSTPVYTIYFENRPKEVITIKINPRK